MHRNFVGMCVIMGLVHLRKSERESEKRELKEAGQVKHPHLLHHVY